MTTVSFVGDLPLWLGLLLATIVAVLSWLYYRRESFDLTHRLRWILPTLRSLAFFLGIMVLTGPVLRHREEIGELGRVKIYVDASQSMNLLDRHLSAGRKLLIAEQQGWLEAGRVDATMQNLAQELGDARQETLAELQREDMTAEELQSVAKNLLTTVNTCAVAAKARPEVPPQGQIGGFPADDDAIHKGLVRPLEELADVTPTNVADAMAGQLKTFADRTPVLEQRLMAIFDHDIQAMLDSGDQSIQAALTMFDETPRWRRAERGLLETAEPLFDELRKHHNVEVLALRDQAAVEQFNGLMTSTDQQFELVESPNAPTTDLTSGIAASQKSVAASDAATDDDGQVQETTELTSKPNTAVVLLTDGQHNTGPSPLQTARVLGGQGIAFYTVSMGATHNAPDLAVTGLEHPQMVFQKDRVRGTVILRDQMPPGQPLVAQVTHDGEVMWQENLLTDNSGERRVDFEFGIEELVERLGGDFESDVQQHALSLHMVASVTPLQDEAETGNNQRSMRFAAITQGYRLLMIDGRSRWETRYMRNVFDRDTQWNVNVVIAGPGNDNETVLRGDSDGMFPDSRDKLFAYDLIVFGEIAPELFQEHEYRWLREFVQTRGGGLIFVDGQRGRMQQMTDQDLRPLLPVEWQSVPIASKPSMLQLTKKGSREPALTFEVATEANQSFWKQLPPPHSVNNVTALPGAEVLVEAMVDGTAIPLMVTRNYGAGRVLYLSSDETWRWRYKAADLYHQRIWNQLAKFVMPRPYTSSDEYLAIDSGAVSYDNGDAANIRIRLKGLDGQPATDSIVDAMLWKNGRVVSTITLNADDDVPGVYHGNSGALAEGEYEVSIRASGFAEEALQARGQFVVLPPESGELEQTGCNEVLLKQMAAESRGTYLREEQLGQLAGLLSPLSSGRVVESTSEIWKTWWWFAAIVMLLTVEWFLRKRAGLL